MQTHYAKLCMASIGKMRNSAKNEEGFSDRLINAREDRNMTQQELAERSGVSLRSIADYELNKTKHGPRMAALEKLAAALGVSYLWLWKGTETPGARPDPGPWRQRAEKAERQVADLVRGMKALIEHVAPKGSCSALALNEDSGCPEARPLIRELHELAEKEARKAPQHKAPHAK